MVKRLAARQAHPITLDVPNDLLKTALAHHQAGRLPEAEAVYRQILDAHPDSADAWHWLGVIGQQTGQPEQAVKLISRALSLRPNYAEAHYNLGFAYQTGRQWDKALHCFQQAILLKPDFAEAYCSLANTLKALGRLEEAALRYRQAISFKLSYTDAHNNLGNTLRLLGQYDEALACFRNALHFKPDAVDSLNNMGVTLQEQKHYQAAGEYFIRVLQIKPDHTQAHNNLGGVLQALGRIDEAIASFERALAIDPGLAGAHNNLGLLYRKRGKQAEALKHFQQALAINPEFAEASYNYHDVQLNCCYWENYDRHVQHINQAVHTGLGRYLPFAFLAVAKSPAHALTCARLYAAEFYPPAKIPLWNGTIYQHPRIRVAYLSADYHNHATAYLMAGLFEKHDRSRFEITAVSFGPPSEGDMRQRLLQAFERFADVRDFSDHQVAMLLREWEIDIAVDLKGYTTEGRPGILAYRPAPIQINYLGYPGSMGCDYLDYIIADRYVLPDSDRPFYTEKVILMPDTYQVNDDQRRIAEHTPSRGEMNLPETGFIFSCFNNNYKINPPLFDVWMRLLRQTDGSVLWLFQNNPLVAANLRQEAQNRGVDPRRLIFAPAVVLDRHLARIQLADLFLDTLPYNAHTTASDALWAGLPVLTCVGESFPGRVAASLLRAIDLPELITENLADYEALALQLATQPERYRQIREKLAQNRLQTPLFDTDRFRRHLESAYQSIYQRQQQGLPPEDFAVPAV